MTIFSIPRAFTGSTAILQRNAINSWLNLPCKPTIILFGDDEGVGDVCSEFGLVHIPVVRKNEYSNYYLDEVFDAAKKYATNNLLCYVNADIIFTEKIEQAVHRILENKKIIKNNFLLVGSRWDFDVDENAEFDESFAYRNGLLHPPRGSDFFIFPTHLNIDMPPFVVGRPYWDNWLIYFFRKNKIPIIDITQYALVFHQNHSYVHVKERTGEKWNGPEADSNRTVKEDVTLKGINLNLEDATHILKENGLISKNKKWYRQFKFSLRLSCYFRILWLLLTTIKKCIRRIITLDIVILFISIIVIYRVRDYSSILILRFAILYIIFVQFYLYLKIKKILKNEMNKVIKLIKH